MNRDRKQESRVKNKQSKNKNIKIPMTNSQTFTDKCGLKIHWEIKRSMRDSGT